MVCTGVISSNPHPILSLPLGPDNMNPAGFRPWGRGERPAGLCVAGWLNGGLEQFFELLLDFGLGGGAYHFVDHLSALEEEDGGDVADAVLHGDVVVVALFDVALAHDDASSCSM